jgi:hypothetical protein
VTDNTTTECLLFPDVFRKPVAAVFDQPQVSSDGGAILLKAADRRLRLSSSLAACLRDGRQAAKIDHQLHELLSQRMFAIACGYPDTNDAARLADDPIHKLLVGRDPSTGATLASQPTLCRFENGVERKELFRMGEALAHRVLHRHRRRLGRRARQVTIDMDATDDPTHGQQQLSFFNGHYDTRCYLPLLAFVSFNHEPEQFLLAAVLQPGNAPPAGVGLGVLRRIVGRVRRSFPKAGILVRLDSGFATPEILDYLDAAGLQYTVGLGPNAVLRREAAQKMEVARQLSVASGQTEHVHGDCLYQTGKTWSRPRRVIFKAEVVREANREPRDNPRFVVTNLSQTPQWIYERVYCERGDSENRIKELHHGLEIDRTSCHRFWANQFRVLLTAAAYVLMQELRLRLAGTGCSRAQVSTLRERLLKLGVHVVVSARRVVLHLPQACPFFAIFRRVALAFGAG